MNHPYLGMVDPRRMPQQQQQPPPPQPVNRMMMRPPVSNFIQRPMPSGGPPPPVTTFHLFTEMSTVAKSTPTIHRPFAEEEVVRRSGGQENPAVSLVPNSTSAAMLLEEEEEEEERAMVVNEEEIATVKGAIKRWLELDDELATLQKAMIERKKERNKWNESIIGFMKNYKTPFFDFDNGHKLVLSTSSAKQPLNKIWIQQILKQSLEETKAQEVERMLLENRPMIEKHKLKRTKPREKRKKAEVKN